MEVKLVLTADYANVSQDGKLNVMGIFSRVLAPNFPATHPLMHLVIVFTAPSHEQGRSKDIRIRLVDDDGKALMDINGNLQIPESPSDHVELQQIFALQMLQFPHPGSYSFQVIVNGVTKATLPLDLDSPAPLGLA